MLLARAETRRESRSNSQLAPVQPGPRFCLRAGRSSKAKDSTVGPLARNRRDRKNARTGCAPWQGVRLPRFREIKTPGYALASTNIHHASGRDRNLRSIPDPLLFRFSGRLASNFNYARTAPPRRLLRAGSSTACGPGKRTLRSGIFLSHQRLSHLHFISSRTGQNRRDRLVEVLRPPRRPSFTALLCRIASAGRSGVCPPSILTRKSATLSR